MRPLKFFWLISGMSKSLEDLNFRVPAVRGINSSSQVSSVYQLLFFTYTLLPLGEIHSCVVFRETERKLRDVQIYLIKL